MTSSFGWESGAPLVGHSAHTGSPIVAVSLFSLCSGRQVESVNLWRLLGGKKTFQRPLWTRVKHRKETKSYTTAHSVQRVREKKKSAETLEAKLQKNKSLGVFVLTAPPLDCDI